MRLRCRFGALAIRNRSVAGNFVGRMLITMPAGCAHLMPDEGRDRNEECGAHEKRRRQHRQVLEHRPRLPSVRRDLRWPAAAAGRRACRRPAAQARHASVSLPFWLMARRARPPARARRARAAPATREIMAATPQSAASVGTAWQYQIGCGHRADAAPTITGERTTTVCSTPTCTSTPDSLVLAAGTATLNTSHGGHAAKGSPCWARATLPIQGGPRS